MNLVDRLIVVTQWPTSRKTVLIAAAAVAVPPLGWLISYLGQPEQPVMRFELLTPFIMAWTLVTLASCLIAVPAALAGREARWTAYVFTLPYGCFMIALIQFFGTSSTGLMAILPSAGLFTLIYYDERIGLNGFLIAAMLLALVGGLEANGVIPYAPLLIERSVDAQSSARWFVTIYALVVSFFSACIIVASLLVVSRRKQEVLLREAQTRLQRSNQLISRYVPSQLAEQILAGERPTDAKPERRKLTIFFSDVEGFTDASDELDAEELSAKLNEYLSEMARIAEHHGATINQFVGDGIMIFFGAPQATNDQDHALRAVRMSLEMQRRMKELQDAWFKRGFQKPFRIRIGINTGYASIGDYGSQGRMVYTAIGLQTNLAARIQAQCEPGRVLISHSTWALVQDEIACEPKGEIQVKGIHYPILTYEVPPPA